MPLNLIISEEETERVMQTASDCVEGECSISEIAELISVLKGTEEDLQERMKAISNMITKLETMNGEENRETDEVRRFVEDLLWVFKQNVSLFFIFESVDTSNRLVDFEHSNRFWLFDLFSESTRSPLLYLTNETHNLLLFFVSQQKPAVTPYGFSGDIGKGPKTAYDAFFSSPKPYSGDKN